MSRNRHAQNGRPGLVSFFSGCGILDLGFEEAGFRTWLANEIDPEFAAAYVFTRKRMNREGPVRGEVVKDSIESFFDGHRRQLLRAAMAEARATSGMVGFIGGPPCPDFSIAGKQAGHSGDRGRLTQDYFDLIGMERPDFFLFENVRGLKSTEKHAIFFDRIMDQVSNRDGYAAIERTVNALDYGAPQDRHRVIVIGFNRDAFPGEADRMAEDFAWEAHATHRGAAKAAVWPRQDALSRGRDGDIDQDIRPPPECLDEHFLELTVQRWFEKNDVDHHDNALDLFRVRGVLAHMREVPEGDTNKKSFKRLHRWRYAPTMAFGNNEVPLHPYRDRRLSVAEALALQSLPKEFVLPPDMTLSDKFKTTGNGVPFLLARGLASSIFETLSNRQAAPVNQDPLRGRTPIMIVDASDATASNDDTSAAPDTPLAA